MRKIYLIEGRFVDERDWHPVYAVKSKKEAMEDIKRLKAEGKVIPFFHKSYRIKAINYYD